MYTFDSFIMILPVANEPVWQLLGKPEALHIKWREGRHHGFDDPQTYFDWFDCAVPESANFCQNLFPGTKTQPLPHAFDWSSWAVCSAVFFNIPHSYAIDLPFCYVRRMLDN